MKWKKWLYRRVFPNAAWIFIHILTFTLRVRVLGREEERKFRDEGKKIVYAFWHGRQFILVKKLAYSHTGVMSSISRDGRLQASILRKFGFEIVEGSSNKSPVRALIGAIQKMQKGYHFAMAVDGPTGPIYKAKPGALFLAKKTNSIIVPLAYSAKPAITLTAWDRYLLPLPFARSVLIYGTPFLPGSDTSPETIEIENNELEKRLNELMQQADTMVRRKHSTVSE